MSRNRRKKRVALFGGTFDPPHIGHGVAMRQILDTGRFDEVWVVPSGIRYDKQSIASPLDRLHMTRLLVRHSFLPHEKITVQPHLVKNPTGYPFTIKEIEFLRKKYPRATFTVAIGPDQARVLRHWHRAEKLFKTVDFLILVRDGRPAHVPAECRATILDPEDAIWMNISSTQLRHRLKKGQSIAGLTPLAIVKFIERKKLYTKP